MRVWGVSALRYIKSEEISPIERMTANEWGSQPAHSARIRHPRLLPAADIRSPCHIHFAVKLQLGEFTWPPPRQSEALLNIASHPVPASSLSKLARACEDMACLAACKVSRHFT